MALRPDPSAVGGVQRTGNLNAQCQSLLQRNRAFCQPLGKGLTVQEFHDQELDALLPPHVVKRADTRVRKLGDSLRLALETGESIGIFGDLLRQHFDRYVAVQPRQSGAPDTDADHRLVLPNSKPSAKTRLPTLTETAVSGDWDAASSAR